MCASETTMRGMLGVLLYCTCIHTCTSSEIASPSFLTSTPVGFKHHMHKLLVLYVCIYSKTSIREVNSRLSVISLTKVIWVFVAVQ